MEHLMDRHPGDALEHVPHQLVAEVRVREALAGCEGRRVGARQQRVTDPPRSELDATHQPTRMRHEVMERDRTERLGQLEPRQELVHRDVERDGPLGLFLQDAERREGLRDRADLEPCVGPDRATRCDVGEAADDGAERVAAVGDRQRETRRVREREIELRGAADPLERFLESGHRFGDQPSKKSFNSRAADSGESDPCTMFSPITVA